MRVGGLGILNAVGVRRDGRIAGRIRDRAVLLGVPVQQAADVDSVDELLFMVPRPLVLRHPLTESPDMAWHAYAVEYGLRVRRLGLRVGVTDIPLTHKSLTVNLARLDVAHAAVAARYPEMLPVRTTCGVVARQTVRSSSGGWLGSQRWRYSWLRESLTVRRARRITGAADRTRRHAVPEGWSSTPGRSRTYRRSSPPALRPFASPRGNVFAVFHHAGLALRDHAFSFGSRVRVSSSRQEDHPRGTPDSRR